MDRLSIGVLGVTIDTGLERFLKGISALSDVEFCPVTPGALTTLRGMVHLADASSSSVAPPPTAPVPLQLTVVAPAPRDPPVSGPVRFADHPALDPVLRGMELTERDAYPVGAASIGPGDVVLATKGDRPAWILRNGHHWTSLARPDLGPHGQLHAHFNRHRFLALLPWIAHARACRIGPSWQRPFLPACFVFDDPNLRSPRYGHLRLRDLAQHARQHGYHAALATIPLDMSSTRPAGARVLRDFPDALSLLFHGNNHTSRELAGPIPAETLLRTLAQAWRRADRLEALHQVPVARIMEAPHGRYAAEVFPVLQRLGFEGALVTPELLTTSNPETPWPAEFGLESCTHLAGGLALLPRIRMSGDWRTEVLLAAYLRQPVLLAGHHQDAVHGIGFLAELARLVRRAGPVRWQRADLIARANYLQQAIGSSLWVRAFARRIDIPIPAGIDQVVLERRWLDRDDAEPLRLLREDGHGEVRDGSDAALAPITVTGMTHLQLACPPHLSVTPASVPPPPGRPWPMLRRWLTEGRDRSRPFWASLPNRRCET